MEWKTINIKIKKSLLNRNLKNPNIRINALDNIEKIIEKFDPEILINPLDKFKSIDKKLLKEQLSKYKKNYKLNSAESSIINEIYYLVNS